MLLLSLIAFVAQIDNSHTGTADELELRDLVRGQENETSKS